MNQESRLYCASNLLRGKGLVVTSKSSTSLPVVGSDSLVHPLCVGRIRVFIHCGTAFAQPARYLVWSHSEAVRLYRSSETNTSISSPYKCCIS